MNPVSRALAELLWDTYCEVGFEEWERRLLSNIHTKWRIEDGVADVAARLGSVVLRTGGKQAIRDFYMPTGTRYQDQFGRLLLLEVLKTPNEHHCELKDRLQAVDDALETPIIERLAALGMIA